LDEAVAAQIDRLIDPEPVAKFRHLDDDRRLLEADRSAAVDNVLVGQATMRSSAAT
jgi:hypothetical protein